MKHCPACQKQFAETVRHCPDHGEFLLYSPGTVLREKYEILGVLGRGGMGVVYRARHIHFNEEKALKVLSEAGIGGQKGIDQLKAEAILVRRLNHPNIVAVEDFDFTADRQPFVVMEFVEGQDLAKKLRGAKALPPAEALRLSAELCSALSAAHAQTIVHRDIKPGNLLLARDTLGRESIKVIDFGLAKVRADAGLGFSGVLTGTAGLIPCTPAYASPEQAFGMSSHELDGRSDIYSAGLVLYEMLTGQLPFAADNWQALLVQRAQRDPAPIEKVRPDLNFPPALSALVTKALAKDRDHRFRRAVDMIDAIAALTNKRPTPDPEKTILTQREAETQATKKVNPKDSLTYVWIPPSATIKGFWLSQTPVTQAAYQRVTGTNPSRFKGGQLPVESVTWFEAEAYCKAVGGRLPTEAEWEHAARGGTTGDLYGELDKIAWYNSNSGNKTHPVAQKQPNNYGLYDMLGNVWEWMDNWYDSDKRYKSLRGGSLFNFPWFVRVSSRYRDKPECRDSYYGFRCVGE